MGVSGVAGGKGICEYANGLLSLRYACVKWDEMEGKGTIIHGNEVMVVFNDWHHAI